MKFHSFYKKIDNVDSNVAAKLVLEYFVYLYEKSIETHNSFKEHYRNALRANREHKDQVNRGINVGHRLPYTDENLINLEFDISELEQQRNETKACLEFVINRLIDSSTK